MSNIFLETAYKVIVIAKISTELQMALPSAKTTPCNGAVVLDGYRTQ